MTKAVLVRRLSCPHICQVAAKIAVDPKALRAFAAFALKLDEPFQKEKPQVLPVEYLNLVWRAEFALRSPNNGTPQELVGADHGLIASLEQAMIFEVPKHWKPATFGLDVSTHATALRASIAHSNAVRRIREGNLLTFVSDNGTI